MYLQYAHWHAVHSKQRKKCKPKEFFQLTLTQHWTFAFIKQKCPKNKNQHNLQKFGLG